MTNCFSGPHKKSTEGNKDRPKVIANNPTTC